MKILLGVDGSKCSEAAIEGIVHRPWPNGTVVRVVAVAHAAIPMIPDPTMTGLAMHEQSLANAREHAEKAAWLRPKRSPSEVTSRSRATSWTATRSTCWSTRPRHGMQTC